MCQMKKPGPPVWLDPSFFATVHIFRPFPPRGRSVDRAAGGRDGVEERHDALHGVVVGGPDGDLLAIEHNHIVLALRRLSRPLVLRRHGRRLTARALSRVFLVDGSALRTLDVDHFWSLLHLGRCLLGSTIARKTLPVKHNALLHGQCYYMSVIRFF